MTEEVDLTFRPLVQRPPEWTRDHSNPRKPAKFEAPYSDTQHRLKYELKQLGATEAFVQIELSDASRGVRNDGQLRADARATHPGVILTAKTPDGTLVFAVDEFVRGSRSKGDDWQQNLRAIALGLEHLRTLDRYGMAARGQQYAGFRELGAGTEMGGGSRMTDDQVAEFLCTAAGWPEGTLDRHDEAQVRKAYRAAVLNHHPDHGGNPAMLAYVLSALDVLLPGG